MEHQWSFTMGEGFINAFNLIVSEKKFLSILKFSSPKIISDTNNCISYSLIRDTGTQGILYN